MRVLRLDAGECETEMYSGGVEFNGANFAI